MHEYFVLRKDKKKSERREWRRIIIIIFLKYYYITVFCLVIIVKVSGLYGNCGQFNRGRGKYKGNGKTHYSERP